MADSNLTLGVTYGHNSSVALMNGSGLVFSEEEERRIRKKLFFGRNELWGDEIDVCAEYIVHVNRSSMFSPAHPEMSKAVLQTVSPVFLGHHRQHYINHHLGHVLAGVFMNPFEKGVVFSVDGGGCWEWQAICEFDGGDLFVFRTNNRSIDVPGSILHESAGHDGEDRSLGRVWSLASEKFGFRKIIDSGKLMALSAHNNAGRVTTRGLLEWQMSDGWIYLPKCSLWDWLLDRTETLHWEEHWEIAVALAQHLQNTTEEAVLTWIEHHLKESTDVVLTGGVFANIKLNRRIMELPKVRDVFVVPTMNDGGLSIGAAYWGQRLLGNRPTFRATDVFAGHNVGLPNKPVDAGAVAKRLAEGAVVGLAVGKMEIGPRALGNRSILAATEGLQREALNRRLGRTAFMPFAPVVLASAAKEIFEDYRCCPANPFMVVSYDVRPEYRASMGCAVHVDGSCRPQILEREFNPYLHEILKEYSRLTGMPFLVNTSLNFHGEPIARSRDDCLRVLEKGGVDGLILGRWPSIIWASKES